MIPPSSWAADIDASAHALREGAPLGDQVVIDGADGRHLARARRLRVGETVTVADGAGTWRAYEVSGIEAGALRLRATTAPAREPALMPRVSVAFALTKRAKPELVVQKLTELGVERILPVKAYRSVARGSDARAGRLARVAREAAVQCRRARLPRVEDLGPLHTLAGHPAIVVAARSTTGGDVSLPEPPGGEWLLLVGPEGGFTHGEIAALTPLAFISVGPYVLRAETAAITAAAVLSTHQRVS